MKKEKENGGRPGFDAGKCQRVGGVIASLIMGELHRSRPRSIAEGLLMMTLATGRVIHILGALMGVEPKRICRDFCEGLTKYFEMGGEPSVDEAVRMFRQKGN